MHHSIRNYGVLIFPVGLALFLGAAPLSSNMFIHTVAQGESVSLICIDYYGYWSPELGTVITEDNPSVKNINIIYSGQKLHLRKPLPGAFSSAAVRKNGEQAEVSGKQKDTSLPVGEMATKKVVQGVVTCVEGSAVIRSSASAAKKPLTVNTVVTAGNCIETGRDGRVEIIVNREAVVRLKENSKCEIETFRAETPSVKKTRIGCQLGSIWTKVRKFRDKISRFELELPTAVAGVHGTVYESVVATDSSAEVKVFSGEVAVSNGRYQAAAHSSGNVVSQTAGPHEVAPPHEVSMDEWIRIVRSMQKIAIGKNGVTSEPVAFRENTGSSWEQWNRKRDRRIAQLFRENH